MELRGFSHSHYIHAIKGGPTTKVLNINSRGKPAIVFKRLIDIYESTYDKAQESLPTQWSREGLEENTPDGCESQVKTQGLYAERRLSNDEPEVFHSDSEGHADGQKGDIEVDSMTIKQIMESCKKRKFRQSKPVDSSKEKLRTSPRLKQSDPCLLLDEEDSDLDVALSIWKSKLSKCKRLKIKCDESRVSTSSQCHLTVGHSDPIYNDQDLPSSPDLLVQVKLETPETDMTEIQNANCIMDQLSLLCDENVNSCLSFGPIGADDLFFSRELSASEKEAECCILNRSCHEYSEGDEPGPLQMVGKSSTGLMSEDNLEVHKPHNLDFPASESMEEQCTPSCVSNDQFSASEKEAEHCILNRSCHEYLEGDEPGPLQMVGKSSTEWMNEDNLEVHKPHNLDFPASESMEEQLTPSCVSNDRMSEAISLTEEQCFATYISQGKCITHEVICQTNSENMSEAIFVTEGQCSDTYISEGKPFTHEAIRLNNGEVFTYLHGTTDLNSYQCPERNPGAEVRSTQTSCKDEMTFDNEKCIPTESSSDCNLSPEHGGSISPKSTSDCNLSPDHRTSISTNSISNNNSSPDQHLASSDECPSKERLLLISDYSDVERNTSPDFHLDDSMDKFNQFEEPKSHPTRLLSTRTAISPTSQEKLSKAMNSMQLQDKERETCGGKPYFDEIKYKVGTVEECDQMKRVYSDIYHEKNIRKSKERSLHSASTTKVPHASMRSSTVQNCSDSVIAFTQRQMKDIECLALKLTTHLKSMKAIVKDRLHVEGNKATSYKFNTDEVRTAIADATKAEANAKKLLTMMLRDCNRFCKIMKTTGHDSPASPASPPAIQKVKRKITFADEVGRQLCEVRLFKDDINAESFVETSPKKV